MRFIILLFFLPFISLGQNCPSGNERVKPLERTFEQEVLKLSNKERKKRGLGALKWDETLAYAARYHSQDMSIDNYFDHNSFDRKGTKLKETCKIFDRIESFISYPYLAENISAGRTSPEEVVKAWMKSSGHRKNILDKNMTRLGVGYYFNENSEYGHYWVQNFGGE